jgi:hypothetical protein
VEGVALGNLGRGVVRRGMGMGGIVGGGLCGSWFIGIHLHLSSR